MGLSCSCSSRTESKLHCQESEYILISIPDHKIRKITPYLLSRLGYIEDELIGELIHEKLMFPIMIEFTNTVSETMISDFKNSNFYSLIEQVSRVSSYFHKLRYLNLKKKDRSSLWVNINPSHTFNGSTVIIKGTVTIIDRKDYCIAPNVPKEFIQDITGQPRYSICEYTSVIIIKLDIAGSSKLSTLKADSEIALLYHRLIKESMNILVYEFYPAIQFVEACGDSLMFMHSPDLMLPFKNSSGICLKFAIRLTQQLNLYLRDFKVHIRSGLSYGDVVGGVIDGKTMRWFGSVVNFAEALESICLQNCICVEQQMVELFIKDNNSIYYKISRQEISCPLFGDKVVYQIDTSQPRDTNQLEEYSPRRLTLNLSLIENQGGFKLKQPGNFQRRPSSHNLLKMSKEEDFQRYYIIRIEVPSHKIIFIDPEFSEILGYQSEELMGQIVHEVLATPIVYKYINQMIHNLPSEISVSNFRRAYQIITKTALEISTLRYFQMMTKYKSLIWVEVNVSVIVDKLTIQSQARFKIISEEFRISPNVPKKLLNKISYQPEFVVEDYNNVIVIMMNISNACRLSLQKSPPELALIYHTVIKKIMDIIEYDFYPFFQFVEDCGDSFLVIHNPDLTLNLKDIVSEGINFTLQITEAVNQYLSQFQVHLKCGMTVGSLCGGIIDGKTMRWFGETINRAARLQGKCLCGNVVVCEKIMIRLKSENYQFVEEIKEHIEVLKGLGPHLLYQISVGTINKEIQLTPHLRASIRESFNCVEI